MEKKEVKMVDLEVKMVENQETESDVRWFGGRPSNSSGRTAVALGVSDVTFGSDEPDRNVPTPVMFNKYDKYYDMTGEKPIYIFNHDEYEKTMYFGYKRPSPRNGTGKDVASLEVTFKGLGFKTFVYHNLSHEDILKTLKRVCRQDHRGTSCIAVAIMTHGDDDGAVYAADRPYQLNDITSIVQNSDPGLVGKPKLMFVQVTLPLSGEIPWLLQACKELETKMLWHLAYRDANGSWLMQSLCDVITEHHKNFDLLQMMTFVHQAVAYRSTYTRCDDTNNKKMMPETKFTLTKLLKF